MSRLPSLRMLIVLTLAGCFAPFIGCASVTIHKVPTPTQYTHWTDEMQRRADAIPGMRFYLPRPFVNVFESFPLRTDIYLADGVLSPDGKTIVITRIRGGDDFAISSSISVPTASVHFPDNSTTPPSPPKPGETPNAQAKELPSDGSEQPAASTPAKPATPAPQSNNLAPSSPAPKTGQNQQSTTNNNGAFAYQPLRGSFDLAYLPDFDEQYAVNSFSGLGNANFQINLGQGWSLQGFNALADNSEINSRIFSLIDTSMQLASSAANAELGNIFPALQQAAKAATGTGSSIVPHGKILQEKTPQQGTQITLKLVVIHYVAKGLYPVIKPRELQERIAESQVTYGLFDLFKRFPRIEWASNYDKNALARAQQAVDPQRGDWSTPRYPYQYLGFNTFRYIYIESILPGAANQKFPSSGVEPSASSTSLTDIVNWLKQAVASQVPSDGGGQKPPDQPAGGDAVSNAIDAALKQLTTARDPSGAADTDNYYTLGQAQRNQAGDGIDANLIVNNGHPADPEATASQYFLNIIQKAGQPQSATPLKLALRNRPSDLTALQKFYDTLKDPTKISYPTPGAGVTLEYKIVDGWLDSQTDPRTKAVKATLTVKLQKVAGGPVVSNPNLETSLTPQAQNLIGGVLPAGATVTVKVSGTPAGP